MPTTTVREVIEGAKYVLAESGVSIRWTEGELVKWLNGGYMAIVQLRDDANAKTSMVALKAGARQSLPEDGQRFLRITQNGEGGMMQPTTFDMLAATRRAWFSEPGTRELELYCTDANEPTAFYVYPPASAEAKAEITYVATPKRHQVAALSAVGDEPISVRDEFADALIDYVLYRAFSKDAMQGDVMMARSNRHYQAFAAALGAGAPQQQEGRK